MCRFLKILVEFLVGRPFGGFRVGFRVFRWFLENQLVRRLALGRRSQIYLDFLKVLLIYDVLRILW
jgi:hypothetical protein